MPKANDQPRSSRGATSAERGRSARAKLLAAAAALIGEVGWNAVSTRLLAERAGVRSGLVHYHFASLQTVLRQAALGEMTAALEQAKAAFAEQSTGVTLTDAMLAELAEYDGTDPSSRVVIEAYLASTRDPILREQMTELIGDFRTAVSTSLARSGHPHPDVAAVTLLAVLDGLILHKGLDPELPLNDAAALISAFLTPEPKGLPQ
ncbi:TetR/AcrR family transcriptional regulator [Microbacterium sp. MPKO10]|uniref:TetR/AcrR family transcriptional regulator n=1 Tax=Microbacterium sp. MPKO10 TaxID=2989818 RepID=UPI002235BD6E|nr:TetR family transcriptional regulator [Microbacterium sp. MPKO10]MCW4459060.1 TetR family transcriptional regulator [Microbacterium sp. MPKO10]